MKKLWMGILGVLSMFIVAQNPNKKTYYPQVFFDEAQAKNRLAYGKSTIKGVAFTRDASGGGFLGQKELAVKEKVVLFPYTNYLHEYLQLRNRYKNDYVVLTPEAYAQRIETTTDEYGNFTFEKMKPGKYYVECLIGFTARGKEVKQTGTTTLYRGNVAVNSYPEYTTYYYNYETTDLVDKVIEIKTEGELLKEKIRPNLFGDSSANPTSTNCYKFRNQQYGTCKQFYKSGQLKSEADWKEDLLHGDYRDYFENGKLAAEGEFKNGFRKGNWKFYYDSGELYNTSFYRFKDNKSFSEGDYIYYHKNGKVMEINPYKDGKLHGKASVYDTDGKLTLEKWYENGVLKK